MLYIISMTICLWTMILIFMSHPISMGSILLIQTMMICFLTGFFNLNFWFSYILFLVMIGGMLILFIYMTSTASNEKFKFSMNMILLTLSLFMLITMFYLFTDNYSISQFSTNLNLQFNNKMLIFSLSKFFNYPMNNFILMMMIYLLITLIAIVKITNYKFGPLRQKS
uniref:NADH-ubiquinone oxidoreductase chain 6 n=1 Tax=Coleoptera sp. ACP-2013 TaxID=2485033 RepID=A0A3G3MEM4_9COLE|nr:NADH dehydrogenase subunit 6 [Coleoptera sp. ACP-2013]